MTKKRKLLINSDIELPQIITNDNANDTQESQNVRVQHKNKHSYRKFYREHSLKTLSVAIPASILDNYKTNELKAFVVSQIARTCVIFGVDEIVIYEDLAYNVANGSVSTIENILSQHYRSNYRRNLEASSVSIPSNESGECEHPSTDLPQGIEAFDDRKYSSALQFFVHNLCYLETPQYLRVHLFDLHPRLRNVGLQNPIGCPHHLRAQDWLPYREGMVLSCKKKISKVDCGLERPITVFGEFPEKSRITVKFKLINHGSKKELVTSCPKSLKRVVGERVSKIEPKLRSNLYWGYQVRVASSLRDAISSCPFEKSYDCLLGTSEHGKLFDPRSFEIKPYTHCLIVFGNQHGLEAVIEDEQSTYPIMNPEKLFHHYLNVMPQQQCRSIRTEEALCITLAKLQDIL